MGVIDNINELVRYGARLSTMKDRVLQKSIASSAKDSIFQFPCLVSKSTTLEMATAATRLAERNYASFVQIVMSQIANVDINVDPTPVHFLRRMHNNMKLENATDEDLRIITERIETEPVVVAYNNLKNVAMVFEYGNDNLKAKELYKLNLEQSREFLSEYDLQPFIEADIRPDSQINRMDILDATARNAMNRSSRDVQALAVNINKNLKAPTISINDAKKQNDSQPFAITIRLNVINEKNEFVQYWDLVVGVKAIMHLIDADEVIENVVRVVQNRGALFNFIRWTTGEISLVRDLILHLDDIKFDMRNRAKGYSAWFPTLKRMKDQKFTVSDFNAKKLIPNSTLIISSSDADILEQKYGIVVKDTVIARRIVKNLFLMAFMVLDDRTQTMDIMYDHSDSFETYALETVQREISMNSNRLANEIGRMIGTSSR